MFASRAFFSDDQLVMGEKVGNTPEGIIHCLVDFPNSVRVADTERIPPIFPCAEVQNPVEFAVWARAHGSNEKIRRNKRIVSIRDDPFGLKSNESGV
jgi:hypothetical protein